MYTRKVRVIHRILARLELKFSENAIFCGTDSTVTYRLSNIAYDVIFDLDYTAKIGDL